MGGFVFSGRVWFIAPKPPFLTLDELCKVVLAGGFENREDGTISIAIYAFSDDDLANRFLQKAGKQASHYFPYSMSDDETVEFLEEMYRRGHRFVGTDAEAVSHVLLSIPAVIEQLRSRR